MKRWRIALVALIAFMLASGMVAGQETTFTWSPYDFSLTLPAGWTAVEDGSRLVVGAPEDVARVLEGEPPADLALTVQIAPSPLAEVFSPNRALQEFPHRDDWTITSAEINGVSITRAEIPPLSSGLTGALLLVESNYLITAFAPEERWDENGALLDTLIAGIQVSPDPLPRNQDLSQHFTWRHISFATPPDWLLGDTGNQFQVIVITRANRLYWGSTFRAIELILVIRDLSYIRPLLTPASLLEFGALLFDPDEASLTEMTIVPMNGLDAASVGILDENGAPSGKAVLLLTPQHAYMLVGVSEADYWAASEGALFEAILATVTIE